MPRVPKDRISACNEARVKETAEYVLYWMIAARRTGWNFAFDRAVEWSRHLRKPLVVLEALRWDFPWASDRIREFVREGMRDNRRSLRGTSLLYYPYLETAPGQGKGLLAALAERACVIITDEFPCFFLPRMVSAAAAQVPARMEQVDSNGLLPLQSSEKEFATAAVFRRFLQGRLPEHLSHFPSADSVSRAKIPSLRALPRSITAKWPVAALDGPRADAGGAAGTQTRGGELRGGSRAARERLRNFLCRKLAPYPERRNVPDDDGASGLSPYLHFGHISVHEIFARLVEKERWGPERLALRPTGSRTGWWGMSPSAEAFLDQLVTWRELGFHFCYHREDHDRFESLPAWAQQTLRKHQGDSRPYRYTLDELARAATHDALWNAAQTQLLAEGRIHNYLRMLWGKKILEWTRSPKEALRIMIELNNRYALDGRDPNSYSGIFWCLGRHDRPWGPERPIFGTVRSMSSANTARKLQVKEYLRRYAPHSKGEETGPVRPASGKHRR